MAVLDLYSKRQKRLRGEVPDVYVYDDIPQELRVQITHVFQDGLGTPEQYAYGDYYADVHEMYKTLGELLCREFGLLSLTGKKHFGEINYMEELFTFILQEKNPERVMDAVELVCKVIDTGGRKHRYLGRQNADKDATAAIEELNTRFKEHGIGFQYVSHEIIRMDSEYLHEEVVKQALALLRDKQYAGAEAEFLSAHEHHRHDRDKEALTDCLKAFESTMKSICDRRKWTYEKGRDASKALIDVCFKNGLIPEYWTTHFSSLRSMLESSVPTARNKESGHGQGAEIVKVPPYLTSYVLHMTAATIVFLVEAERALL